MSMICKCPRCEGMGQITCAACDGTGQRGPSVLTAKLDREEADFARRRELQLEAQTVVKQAEELCKLLPSKADKYNAQRDELLTDLQREFARQ